MRILINGCWRSGSTGLFNLVRMICEENGTTYGCFEDTYNEEIAETHDFEIVKIHKYKHHWVKWTDVVFTIFREPEEVRASMERFHQTGGREYKLNDLLRGLAYWGHYNQYAAYSAWFNQLYRSTEKLAQLLAEQMDLEIDEKKVVKRFRKIKPPKTGYDPVTLLHANHVTQ